MTYLPNRRLTKFLVRIFMTQYDLFVCARKRLSHSFHARIAILKAFLWTRMSDRTKTCALFLALEQGMSPIIRMTNHGTDMSAKHFRGTFVHAPSFRRKICHFTSLKEQGNMAINYIFPTNLITNSTYFDLNIMNITS